MEIISQNDGILCDYEVLSVVSDRKSKSPPEPRNDLELQDRETMERKILKYMAARGTCDIPMDSVASFMASIASHNISLTKAEVMVVLNMMPSTVVEIHLIVEECVERLTEEDIQHLLECVKNIQSE